MKRLFNVLLVIALMLSATSVSARGFRNGHRGYHDFYTVTDGMGISAGYAHSAYRLSDWATDEVKKADGLNGLNFLVTKDFSIYEDMIFLQPGVGYTYLNDSRNMSEGTVRIIGDWDEHYLSIPVKIKYDAKATKVWVASPDQHAGAAQELAFTQENGYISVVLPSLEYWTMLVIE